MMALYHIERVVSKTIRLPLLTIIEIVVVVLAEDLVLEIIQQLAINSSNLKYKSWFQVMFINLSKSNHLCLSLIQIIKTKTSMVENLVLEVSILQETCLDK